MSILKEIKNLPSESIKNGISNLHALIKSGNCEDKQQAVALLLYANTILVDRCITNSLFDLKM